MLCCLKNCLVCQQPIVGYEIVLSLSRLVRAFNQELTLVEWDIIVESFTISINDMYIVHGCIYVSTHTSNDIESHTYVDIVYKYQ